MLEYFLILGILFIVLVIFYKQANDEFTILQLEGNQLHTLSSLVTEKNPIVIRQTQMPTFFTPDAIRQNARILTFPIATGKTLRDALTDSSLTVASESQRQLAQEVGLHVWAEHTWMPWLTSWSFLHRLTAEAKSGEQGLQKTTAVATVLLPTAQPLTVCIITGSQEKYFPPNWCGGFPELFTLQDTPLVGQIKFMEVKVKPGNALCLPPHWFYSVRKTEEKSPCFWVSLELHHPLSMLSKQFEQNDCKN